MKATNKISTLRANGVSVVNCNGFLCLVSAEKPFSFGERQITKQGTNGLYQLKVGGHYKVTLPMAIGFI